MSDAVQIPHGKGHVPRACPAHSADECIRRRKGLQHCDAAFCQVTLDTCYAVISSGCIFHVRFMATCGSDKFVLVSVHNYLIIYLS